MGRSPMMPILSILFCHVAIHCVSEEPGRVQILPETIIAQFDIPKDGDALVVPVHIAGKERLFIVDTGYTMSAFQVPKPLKPKRTRDILIRTYDGILSLPAFDFPEASIADIPLELPRGFINDNFQMLDQNSGHHVEGVLGKDFLSRYIIHIDFDHGKLFLLNKRPPDAGEAFVISLINKQPCVLAEVGDEKIPFVIDTGGLYTSSGTLFRVRAEKLEKKGIIRRGSKVENTSPRKSQNNYQVNTYRSQRLRLGSFELADPHWSSDELPSTLGLGFWSNFAVTIDFPNRSIYLRKGEHFAKPITEDRSGLELIRKGDAFAVTKIHPTLAGRLAGFRIGDELISIGNLRTPPASLFQFREALCVPGTFDCVVKRGSENLHLPLRLAP